MQLVTPIAYGSKSAPLSLGPESELYRQRLGRGKQLIKFVKIRGYMKTARVPRLGYMLQALSGVLFFLLTISGQAQVAGTGTIQGTVQDPTGALIPNAIVTLTDVATHVKRVAQSDSSGTYTFPNISIGTYDASISAKGFQTYVKSGNVLEVGSNIAINATLTVGSQEQTVQVAADGLALQTEDVSFKQTIDSTAITEMPLNGRQMTGLIVLSGGATPASGGDSITGSKASYAAIAISIAGGQGNTTQWKLDGGDNNDYMSNGNLPFPFPDAVSQFSVESTALGAQNGEHSGGLVNVVTHSGSNTYHGSAFEFIRNNYLDATNFFSSCTPVAPQTTCSPKDSLHQNQYGGTFGGKILRDKLFAFAGYQRTKADQSQASTTAYVPSQANLLGNFSQSDPTVQLVNPLTGAPLPGNQISPTLFSPQALALVKMLPTSTAANGLVLYAIPSQTSDNQFVTRVDYTINAKNNLYGRYFIDGYQSPAFYSPTNILITTQSGNSERVQSFVLGENYTFSSSTVNSAHITLARRRNDRGYNQNDINATDLGVTAYQAADAGLYLSVGSKFTLGCGTCAVAQFNDNFLAVEDEVTMVRGKHQIVFGGEIVHNQLNVTNIASGNGQFTFSGNYSINGPHPSGPQKTGDNNLDFLMGAMSAFAQSKTQGNALRGNIPSLYVQDTFHATPQLTAIAGIRWSPDYFPVDVFNRGTTFSLAALQANQVSVVYPTAPAGTFFYGDPGVTRQFTQNAPFQFSPNVGIAYDVTGKGDTVVRAGAEYIYDEANWFTNERTTQNPPFATSIAQAPTSSSGPLTFANPWAVGTIVGDPFPLPDNASPADAVFPLQSDYEVLPSHFKVARTMQWTLSLQQKLGRGWEFQLDYIGNKTNHIAQGIALSPATYVPGIWGSGGAGCAGVVRTGPAGVAPGAAGTPCSTVANQAARFFLTQQNPVSGPKYAGGGSGATLVGDGGIANYNGMIATVQHRLSSTFSLLANYTWSKCLNENDASGDVSTTSVSDPLNPHLDYGPCGSDYRHIVNIVLVVKSNFAITNRFTKAVVNGWEVAPLTHILSGAPFSVGAGVDNSLTDIGQDRPNVVPGVPIYIKQQILVNPSTHAYLNPLAFCSQPTKSNPCTNPVPQGGYGTESRNSLRGIPSYQFDAQVSRIFPIHDRLNLTLRLEAFNVLNHPNFNTPQTSLTSSTFGQISGSSAARIFQGVVKLTF